MNTLWQLQDAKNQFSKLVKQAAAGRPQTVTVHGRPTAVLISADEYQRLTQRSQASLVDTLLRPGLLEDDSVFERDRDLGREIEF